MKFSLFGRLAMALFASLALGLGMTGCGGGTIGYMWVLGQQYNQIAGFKIDDYTGNLTDVIGSPFVSNGAVPVSLVIKPGGRYLYVINQGTGGTSTKAGVGQSIAVFSVGGDGVLTFQEAYASQGYVSQWAQFDGSGTYLYVLDKYSPSGDGNGAITVYSTDATTGRLTLVTNAQTQINGVNTTYFEVGPNPFMMKSQGGCLYTANSGNQSITPLAEGGSGQLTFTTTQVFNVGSVKMTSITGGSNFIFVTDAGATPGTTAGTIFGYTGAAGCGLTAVNGGTIPTIAGTTNPTYTFLDTKGIYLYVLNQSTTSTTVQTAFSSISAYSLNTTNNEFQAKADSPFTVGAGPVCMVEDPTGQYMYVSNHNDGTVTGKFFNSTNGDLSDLKRGSTFPSVGQSGCLVESGAVN